MSSLILNLLMNSLIEGHGNRVFRNVICPCHGHHENGTYTPRTHRDGTGRKS